MATKVLIIRPNQTKKADGVDVYCQNLFELMSDADGIDMLPIENYPASFKPYLHLVYEWDKFMERLQEIDFDVMHINGYATYSVHQAFKAACLLNKKIIYTGHFHPFSTTKHPLGLKLFNNLLLRPYYKNCNAITTLNSEDTAFYRQYTEKVERIPHWSKFDVSEQELSRIKKENNMILFVGRFDSFNKGIDHLFYLPEGKYDIHCVGRGNLPKMRSDMTIHREISDDELKELYGRASLLVVPSSYEAFSFATLEALSMNTPVVISNGVRIGDYLHDFTCCSYFDFHDYQAFVDAVAKTIGKSVQRDAILSIFNRDIIRNKYAQLYRNL